MNMRWTIISLLALVAHTPVSAKTAVPPTAVVRYSDLDLRTKAGASALRARIDNQVIVLSEGEGWSDQPDLIAARRKAQAQADALIAIARSAAIVKATAERS